MSHSAVIRTSIDPTTKAATERVLSALGLTPSEAVRLLYRQIAMRGEFPLELRVPNKTTAAALRKAEAGKGLESFKSL